MEEMTEVELDGKRYLWDGDNWCDPKTYMEPPEAVVNRLNETYRKHELKPAPAARNVGVRSPRRTEPRAKFVPASLVPEGS